jgi:ubiquitin-activating enzyme E1
VGKSRGEVTVPRLAELNSYVPVNLLEGQGEITTDMIKNFQVVVLTNTTLSKQIEIDEYCHNNGIAFIAADVRGLFGLVTPSRMLTRSELMSIFVCMAVTLSTISVRNSPA